MPKRRIITKTFTLILLLLILLKIQHHIKTTLKMNPIMTMNKTTMTITLRGKKDKKKSKNHSTIIQHRHPQHQQNRHHQHHTHLLLIKLIRATLKIINKSIIQLSHLPNPQYQSQQKRQSKIRNIKANLNKYPNLISKLELKTTTKAAPI